MSALVVTDYDDWETQVDNESRIYIENINIPEIINKDNLDAVAAVAVAVVAVAVVAVAVAPVTPVTPVTNGPKMTTPLEFMRALMRKNYATFLAEKKLPPYKKTVRAINLARDHHLARIDVIREIINGRAILIKSTIDWYKAGSPKFDENSPMLRDPCKWKIITYEEHYKNEAKHMSDCYGITTAPTKKQLKSR